ncbi:unnamed protein product [Caenorhabditis angaria]|uniref:G-protein coupled receptors family 1 profile domain-containing protein n=1 Tax=Caenorhabditis angaria TaxID=860376 RepID=A0A9P1IF29_9PELO|nr:unnamed protein product [Caenorhabditis angaria]
MNSTIALEESSNELFPIILLTIKLGLNSIGLFLNCVLLWLILVNCRNMYKTLSILLIYTLFNDMTISITMLLEVKRLVICHETYVMVYYDRLLRKDFCQLSELLSYCLMAYLPGLVTVIWFLVQFEDSSPLVNSLQKCTSEIFTHSTISGYESYHKSPMPYAMALLILPNIPHYFLAFCFRHKQNHDLKRRSLSTSTLKMHSTLRKISTLKAFLPLFLFFDVMIYTLCQLELLPPQMSQYFLGTISSSINILNPLIAIMCFRPYRGTVKATWRKWTTKLSRSQHKVIFSEEEEVEAVSL